MVSTPPTAPLPAAPLLDTPVATELLAAATEAAGLELIASTRRSVHERPGRSRSDVHAATLRVGDATREVLLVLHVDARTLPAGTFTVSTGPHPVAVWRFPHDPYLPGLASAVHPGRVRELLDRLGGPPGAVRLRTRAYRPTRRAVVEVAVTDGAQAARILYLKVLAGARAEELAAVHRAAAGAGIPVPRVVGVAGGQGLVALEARRGRTLREAVIVGDRLPDPSQLVALSSRLAATGLPSRRDPRAFADPTRHVELLTRLLPDQAGRIARIVAVTRGVEGEPTTVHGDLHAAQLLLVDGAITGLLDVDGAGTGLLAEDAGALVAHLEVIGELHPAAAERATAYAHEVAAAYAELVGDRALALATAAAWVGLATGPYRAQEAGWEQTTMRRLEQAEAALG